MTLREALHEFAVTYRIETRESRRECLNEIIGKINAMLPRKLGGGHETYDDAIDDMRKGLGL
jgi:hypothetical protein